MATTDANDFARRVSGNPRAMAVLHERGSLIKRMAAPLDVADVFRALQPLVVLFGAPDYGRGPEADAMIKAWRDQYAKALRNVPFEALEFAVSEYIRAGHPTKPSLSDRFPLPSVLIELARPKAEEIHMIAYRVKVALERTTSTKPEKTPEEIAEAKAFLASLRGGKSLAEAVMSTRPAESRQDMASRIRQAAAQ